MANPIYRTYTVVSTEVGPQSPVNLDWLNIFQLGIGVWLEGSAQYSVEGTFDDVIPPAQGGQAGAANPARWFTLDQFPVGGAASKAALVEIPFLWVRLNLAAIGANVEFKVQQASNMRGF
jgi:hypothetical protein